MRSQEMSVIWRDWKQNRIGVFIRGCIVALAVVLAIGKIGLAQNSQTNQSYAFTTINIPEIEVVPGLTPLVSVTGINDIGDIVGTYQSKTGLIGAFILPKEGTPVFFEQTDAAVYAYGINNDGKVTGHFLSGRGIEGFIYNIHNGAFLPVDCPPQDPMVPDIIRTTTPHGNNNNGDFVGTCAYIQTTEDTPSFASINGVFMPVIVPEFIVPGVRVQPIAYAINDNGTVVGDYGDARGRVRGFIGITPIDVPGASAVHLSGINKSGTVVGTSDAPGYESFIYRSNTLTPLSVPDQNPDQAIITFDTTVGGINNKGQIVGFYTDSAGRHIFVATPDRRFDIRLTMFIPLNHIKVAFPFPAASLSTCSTFVFDADDRTFNKEGRFRVRQEAKIFISGGNGNSVVTEENIDRQPGEAIRYNRSDSLVTLNPTPEEQCFRQFCPDCPVYTPPFLFAGETIIDQGKCITDAARQDNILEKDTTGPLIQDRGFANVDGMRIEQLTASSSNVVKIAMQGSPYNPLVPISCTYGITPHIDWYLELEINMTENEPRYSLKGSHDGFPAYELYINDNHIYQYDPIPNKRTPLSLFSPVKDIKVSCVSQLLNDMCLTK